MDTSLREEYVKEETPEDIARSEKTFEMVRNVFFVFAAIFFICVGTMMYLNPPIEESTIRDSLYRSGAAKIPLVDNWIDPDCRIEGCPTRA